MSENNLICDRREFITISTCASAVPSIMNSARDGQKIATPRGSMHIPKWALFFDFHTMPANPDVGQGVRHGRHHRLDQGMRRGLSSSSRRAATWARPTTRPKLGIPHPAMKRDLFGDLVAACHAKGIAISATSTSGLSHEEAYRHRDWTVLRADGRMYGEPFNNSFFRQMCYNTAYAEHVIGMAREVVDLVSASTASSSTASTRTPCIGRGVHGEDEGRGGGLERPRAAQRLQLPQDADHGAEAFGGGARRSSRTCSYTSTVSTSRPRPSWAPTWSWSACRRAAGATRLLPMVSRYMRTLGKPVLNMTGPLPEKLGRFRRHPHRAERGVRLHLRHCQRHPPDHRRPLPPARRPEPGGHGLGQGRLRRLRPLQPWIEGAQPVVEMANVMKCDYPGYWWAGGDRPQRQKAWRWTRSSPPRGCCVSSRCSLTTSPTAVPWDKYKVLILPDEIELTTQVAERLKAHLDRGGAIISTGWSGLDEARKRFVLDAWGVEYKGEDPFDPAYIRFTPEFATGMPDMPVTLYERGTAIATAPGTEVLATIIAPYYNDVWDGSHGNRYTPPDKDTGRPAVIAPRPCGACEPPHLPRLLHQRCACRCGRSWPTCWTDSCPSL